MTIVEDSRATGFAQDQLLWLARALGVIIPPPPKSRLPARKQAIGSSERTRADARLQKLPEKERKRYDALVKEAKSDDERDYVAKALATNHSVAEIEAFDKKIHGKDAAWMQNNLKLTGSTKGTGVKQQWSHSCNATTVQAVQAELDPIYALKLHEENPDLTKADEASGTRKNPKLAAEQKKMLESKYTGKGGGAAGSSGTAAARSKGELGSGRWADDLLNARSATTGLTYTTKFLDKNYTLDKATQDLDKALAKGQPVPIVIGDGAASASAHYVLVTTLDPGPPKQ